MKKRALISVFYKDGVLEFAKFLEKKEGLKFFQLVELTNI